MVVQVPAPVAEDNPDLLEMACRLFEALGQDAQGAASVEDALALLAAQSAHPVDVLFTDIDLAGQSGVELARRARAVHPRVHVVFASGYGAPPGDALQGGFQVLPKPYRLEDLSSLVQQVATMRA